MVALPQAVDVEKQAGQGGNSVLIPKGQYQAVIVGSEYKDTKSGGGMLVVTTVITQGEYANSEFRECVNIVNSNAKAVEIAYQTLANMGKAIGIASITDSNQLHNIPLMIEVTTEPAKDWTNDKGESVKGKDKSKIKKYLKIPKTGVPDQVAPAPVEQAAVQAAVQEAPMNNIFAPSA